MDEEPAPESTECETQSQANLSPLHAVIPHGHNGVPEKKSSNMYIFHEQEEEEGAEKRYQISFRKWKNELTLFLFPWATANRLESKEKGR